MEPTGEEKANEAVLVRALVRSTFLSIAVLVGAWLLGIWSWVVPAVAVPLVVAFGAVLIWSLRRGTL
jgi:Flp pilus assembly protein TadB